VKDSDLRDHTKIQGRIQSQGKLARKGDMNLTNGDSGNMHPVAMRGCGFGRSFAKNQWGMMEGKKMREKIVQEAKVIGFVTGWQAVR